MDTDVGFSIRLWLLAETFSCALFLRYLFLNKKYVLEKNCALRYASKFSLDLALSDFYLASMDSDLLVLYFRSRERGGKGDRFICVHFLSHTKQIKFFKGRIQFRGEKQRSEVFLLGTRPEDCRPVGSENRLHLFRPIPSWFRGQVTIWFIDGLLMAWDGRRGRCDVGHIFCWVRPDNT